MAKKNGGDNNVGKEIRELKFAIKLFLEEGREHRKDAEKDRKQATEDRKQATEDRKQAAMDRKEASEDRKRMYRSLEKMNSNTAGLIRVLDRQGRKIAERLTSIENILRRMSNGFSRE